MKKFNLTATVTITLTKEIEAETAEDAELVANSLNVPELCNACARGGGDESWELGCGIDGEPLDIKVEED